MSNFLRSYDVAISFKKNIVMAIFQGVGMGIGLGLATDGLVILLVKIGAIKLP